MGEPPALVQGAQLSHNRVVCHKGQAHGNVYVLISPQTLLKQAAHQNTWRIHKSVGKGLARGSPALLFPALGGHWGLFVKEMAACGSKIAAQPAGG